MSRRFNSEIAFLIKICPLSVVVVVVPPLLSLFLTFHIFISFPRTTGPISTKLGTKLPWVKGIQVCSNEGPVLFPTGDNYEIAKTIDEILKSPSQETLGQFQPNLAQTSLVKGMKGPVLFQGEIITKKRKYIDEIKKIFS